MLQDLRFQDDIASNTVKSCILLPRLGCPFQLESATLQWDKRILSAESIPEVLTPRIPQNPRQAPWNSDQLCLVFLCSVCWTFHTFLLVKWVWIAHIHSEVAHCQVIKCFGPKWREKAQTVWSCLIWVQNLLVGFGEKEHARALAWSWDLSWPFHMVLSRGASTHGSDMHQNVSTQHLSAPDILRVSLEQC